MPLSRRTLLQASLGGAALASLPLRARDGELPRFLIVVTAAGGASIVDGPLASRHRDTADWRELNVFPDDEVVDVAGTPFRAVDLRRSWVGDLAAEVRTRQSAFIQRHHADMLVVTHTGTSVNHAIAQQRSLNGNGVWAGRTLQEAVAAQWGRGMALPNVNMASQAFVEPGEDRTLPSWAVATPIAETSLWPLGLDGHRGIRGAPDRALFERARQVRNELDRGSVFQRTFGHAPTLERWQRHRAEEGPAIEALDLISRLNLIADNPEIPVESYGLSHSPDTDRLREAFPDFLFDPLHGQAALAFLLLKNQVSATVTLGLGFDMLQRRGELISPPQAFDFAHQAHRGSQALLWQRVLDVVDRLIVLLKAEPLDEASGISIWDRTLLYVASDFGRSRQRVGGQDEFGTGHHLNNGSLLLSPMLKGNTLLGGVDRQSTLTWGWDPLTGAPDPGRENTLEELYAGILQVLDVDTPSHLPSVPVFAR